MPASLWIPSLKPAILCYPKGKWLAPPAARYDEGMGTNVQKVGWIGQAVIVAIGSIVGAFFANLLVPTPLMHVGDARQAAIWAWCVASCGAIAGGLLFSWIKDR